MKRISALSVIALFAVSCGTEETKKEYSGSSGSCVTKTPEDTTFSFPEYSSCQEWNYKATMKKDPAADSVASTKALCTATAPATATFTEGKKCDQSGAVAKCVLSISVTSGGETYTDTGTTYYYGEAYRDKFLFDLSKGVCTDVGKGTWTTITEPLASWDFSGTYRSTCKKNSDSSDAEYEQSEYYFLLGDVTYTTKNYGADSTCAAASLSYESGITGTYKVGLEAAAPTGFRKMNWKIKTFTVTPKVEAAVTAFNSASLYGKTDWALDTAFDATGKKANSTDAKATASVDQVFYDIVKLENNVVTVGEETKELDRSTDAKRPNKASTDTFTKVP